MGTPDFAVGILKELLDHKYAVVGVVTAPDKPSGRGRKLNESAVKKFALEHKLTILQPVNLKDEIFLEQLKSLNANLQIVVAFRMLPKVVWQLPCYGTFNLHASLLPQYRGAAPINWAIINGETTTGVTTFFIDDQIDTGAIILQKKATIFPTDNAGTLHDRLMVIGAETVMETVEQIKMATAAPTVQVVKGKLKEAPKLHKETCKINWNLSLLEIQNFIRGLSPYPTAWTQLFNGDDQFIMKIYSSDMDFASHHYDIGTVISSKKSLKIATKDGFIIVLEIQMPGKRKMTVTEFLNGIKFSERVQVS